MNDKIVRINIRLPDYVRDWFKVQADRYSVPYTNYVSMLLTQIYERETDKELLRDLNNALNDIKNLTGNVTAEEMFNQLKQMQDIITRKYKIDG